MTRSGQPKMFPEIPPGSRILRGEEISSLIHSANLIDPFSASHLAPCSYDLSAGKSYVSAGGGVTPNTSEKPLILGPGSYAGVMSAERVKIPANIYVVLGPKRKLSYDGIILLSGSVIDPGYEGHLLFVLYNSSGRKRTMYPGKKICVATFFQLDKAVPDPLGPDLSLSAGNFPGEFLDSMANMELPSMVEITEKLKEIHALERRILQLEETYTGVTKPIRELTETVGKISQNVDALTKEGERVLGKLGEHDTRLSDLSSVIREHSVKLNSTWVLVVIVLTAIVGGTIGWLINKAASGGAPTTNSTAVTPSSPTNSAAPSPLK
jgi:deoxycytidine triphosphate deaminase